MARIQRSTHSGHRDGFTILETMLAMSIILVGVLSVIQAQRSFMFNNQWSSHAATANYLANEIREMTRTLPRHDRFSGGLYFSTPGDESTLSGWGLETNELLIADIDDLDDLDGAVFGTATDFPEGFTMTQRFTGPINAFGEVIDEVMWDGSVETVELDGEVTEVAMRGWTQIVEVEKVDPWDYSLAVDLTENEANVRSVDEYPLRVTVTVLYQGVWTTEAPPITSVSWIVPP
ncbi:MAG: hypothetical protein AAFX05_01110 [Planctomycetota bacterium]